MILATGRCAILCNVCNLAVDALQGKMHTITTKSHTFFRLESEGEKARMNPCIWGTRYFNLDFIPKFVVSPNSHQWTYIIHLDGCNIHNPFQHQYILPTAPYVTLGVKRTCDDDDILPTKMTHSNQKGYPKKTGQSQFRWIDLYPRHLSTVTYIIQC